MKKPLIGKALILAALSVASLSATGAWSDPFVLLSSVTNQYGIVLYPTNISDVSATCKGGAYFIYNPKYTNTLSSETISRMGAAITGGQQLYITALANGLTVYKPFRVEYSVQNNGFCYVSSVQILPIVSQ